MALITKTPTVNGIMFAVSTPWVEFPFLSNREQYMTVLINKGMTDPFNGRGKM